MAFVELGRVRKRFGTTAVIRDVDLAIEEGRFCVLVGPSGCGKSTLLRMIAGLEEIDEGELRIDGKRMNEVRPADRGVSMVFQSYALYPHMNVYRNMAFGLRLAKTDAETVDSRVRAAAQMLQIDELLERLPRELSGGQRQRVAIGRAIVRQPRVFLFDEPLSNLDAALRVQMRLEIARLHERLGTTIIYVTHDQVEAMTLADQIVVLNGGRVEQVGAPLELYRRPRNLFVAGFIGSPRMNLLPATVREHRADAVVLALDGGTELTLLTSPGLVSGERATLGIRPEQLRVGSDNLADLTLPFAVEMIEELGDARLLHGRVGSGPAVTVRQSGDGTARRGEQVTLAVDPAHIHLFGADGRRLPTDA
jgi:multiple sugar transport system ATP-binding protein